MSSPLPLDSSGEITFHIPNVQGQDDICVANIEAVSDCESTDVSMVDEAINTFYLKAAVIHDQIESMATILKDVVKELKSIKAGHQGQGKLYSSTQGNRQGQNVEYHRQHIGQRSDSDLQGQNVRHSVVNDNYQGPNNSYHSNNMSNNYTSNDGFASHIPDPE
jgi:hypothetical protein